MFDIRFVWGSQLGSPFLNVFLAAAFLTAPSWMMKLFNDDAAEKAVREKIAKLLAIQGTRSVDDIHKELGHIMWNYVGMARNKAGLTKAME